MTSNDQQRPLSITHNHHNRVRAGRMNRKRFEQLLTKWQIQIINRNITTVLIPSLAHTDNCSTSAKKMSVIHPLTGTRDFLERRSKGFSQGQRTKVALARALVHNPKNVLLDEPTNGLDVMATRGLRGVIGSLKKAGHCVLLSSHIMQEVAALCDEIVIISKGKIASKGSPAFIRESTGEDNLEDAFVKAIGSDEGLV